MGTNRPEARFEYPNNIKSFQSPLDATRIANEVIALGAGIGTATASVSDVTNNASQLTYKLRQDLITVNGNDNSQGVVDATANTDLAAWGVPIEIPQLVVDGNKLPFVGSYDVGDYVFVKLGGYKWFDSVNGMRRIEKYTVAISDDDVEDVTVYLQI
jgi:SAM-dependent methyltransferase